MNTPIETPTPDFSPLKSIVYSLWETVRKEMFSGLEVETKDGKELVTRIDRMIEKQARQMIHWEFGNVNFLGEEYPDADNGSDITFIIDPLDGTESFINREYNTTISIGVEIWGVLVYGIVYDFMKDVLYEWGAESKVFFKKQAIPLLREKFSSNIRVLISGRWEEVENMYNTFRSKEGFHVTRMYGSVALQMMQTGWGTHDAYIRVGKVKPWDVSWGTPFIQNLPDTQIFARNGSSFNHHTPEQWLIIVRNRFQEQFLNIVL